MVDTSIWRRALHVAVTSAPWIFAIQLVPILFTWNWTLENVIFATGLTLATLPVLLLVTVVAQILARGRNRK